MKYFEYCPPAGVVRGGSPGPGGEGGAGHENDAMEQHSCQ